MAKKRVKSDKPIRQINSWTEADEFVRAINKLQLKINSSECKASDKINNAKSELKNTTEPLQEQIDEYVRSLEAFAAAHKKDFGNQQSKKLNYGTIGWRRSTKIIIKKTTLGLIKKVFSKKAEQYIRIKEEVDKEALARLRDEDLSKVEARRRRTEPFFVEPDLPEAVDYTE